MGAGVWSMWLTLVLGVRRAAGACSVGEAFNPEKVNLTTCALPTPSANQSTTPKQKVIVVVHVKTEVGVVGGGRGARCEGGRGGEKQPKSVSVKVQPTRRPTDSGSNVVENKGAHIVGRFGACWHRWARGSRLGSLAGSKSCDGGGGLEGGGEGVGLAGWRSLAWKAARVSWLGSAVQETARNALRVVPKCSVLIQGVDTGTGAR